MTVTKAMHKVESLSVSDDPSNTLDREQTILGETGSDLSQMALGHQTGTVSGGSHVQESGSGDRILLPNGHTSSSICNLDASPQAYSELPSPEESSLATEHKQVPGQHIRHPSNLSVPESDISSNGTFIDKGSLEEVKDGRLEADLGLEAVAMSHPKAGVESSAVPCAPEDQLQPPESAFSTSDLSEQLSGTINEDGLQCLTCKITATSEGQLAIHMEGKKHRRHVALAELQENAPVVEDAAEVSSGQDLHCHLCDVTAPTPQHSEYHLRGQKHQRREKQHQLMEASAELANNSVNALLTDSESDSEEVYEKRQLQGDAVASGAEILGDATEHTKERAEEQKPLKSPFEEFAPSKPLPQKPHRNVRFNGGLESFSEEPEGVTDENGPNPPLPPMSSSVSTNSYKLVSGGSFSSPAAHYCPVCGIIATSEANLEDHYQGRRHARRLQYLSHMPDGERNEHLQRTLTAASSGLFRQGSLVLPSSMDLTAYIGTVAQVHPAVSPAGPRPVEGAANFHANARRPLNKTLSNQQLSWDSVNGLHLHREEAGPSITRHAESEEATKASASDITEDAENTSQNREENAFEPQPKCDICGITTTSRAHMEAHKAGRKHRRRMEAAAGRSTVKSLAHYCPLCEISTTSSAHLALHLVGRAHRRRQKALEDGESLHPISLLPTSAAAASETLDMRSNGDAVSNTEDQASIGDPTSSSIDTHGDARNLSYGHHPRPGVGSIPPPMSGRANSQPEIYVGRASSSDSSRQAGARAPSFEPGSWRSPSLGSQRHPVLAKYPSTGLPPMNAHPGYPVGMYQLPPPYFQQGNMQPYPPGSGCAPYLKWWPGGMPATQHQYPGPGHYQEGTYPHLIQYPGPRMYPGSPHHQYPLMGVPLAGGFPGLRPPAYPHYDPHQRGPRGMANSPHKEHAKVQQDMYNCEVCNIQTERLDELKQHLRGKNHKRRLYTPSKGT